MPEGGDSTVESELYQVGSTCGEGAVAADLGAILRRMQVRRKESSSEQAPPTPLLAPAQIGKPLRWQGTSF